MNRKRESLAPTVVFWFLFMSAYTLISSVQSLGDAAAAAGLLGNIILTGIISFGVIWYICYEFTGMFEELNKPRDRSGKDSDKSGSGDGDSGNHPGN